MSKAPIIIWFRQDLRRMDNPALHAAYESGHPVIPVYILDDDNAGRWKMGDASRWWLHQNLQKLDEGLNNHLVIRKGDACEVLPRLAQETNAGGVYWNRCYEPWRIARDKKIKQRLQDENIEAESFNGSLLWEPWQTLKDDGTPYKVFTPFYRGCLSRNGAPSQPLPAPERLTYGPAPEQQGTVDGLNLIPKIKWYGTMAKTWTPGEDGAHKRLDDFLEDGLQGYDRGRDRPDLENVSRLSPYLHFGALSPRQVWHAVQGKAARSGTLQNDTDKFCSELGWREFSYSLLYHFPQMPSEPLQDKFANFPWEDNKDGLRKWQAGETGFPIVDAGMRELWATGYMHNRVRMIVASFLIKDLLLHWHEGEAWFWDTLCDADLANNSASWQWVAGCGADAAPFFRIFNPITQGSKFDPDGTYIRKWVPELAKLEGKDVHEPWNADNAHDYPPPCVNHKEARKKALALFKGLS